MDLKKGGRGLRKFKTPPCHPIPSHSSFVLLKTAEFAFKDIKSNDNPAVTSSGKEQKPGETSSGQSTNSAAGGLLTSLKQAYTSNPLICEQVGDPGRNPVTERQCSLISITTAPSSVPASHGSISLGHKISHPAVPWQSAGELKAPKHRSGGDR